MSTGKPRKREKRWQLLSLTIKDFLLIIWEVLPVRIPTENSLHWLLSSRWFLQHNTTIRPQNRPRSFNHNSVFRHPIRNFSTFLSFFKCAISRRCRLLKLYSVDYGWLIKHCCNDNGRRKPKYSEKNPPQCHNRDRPDNEPGPPRWGVGH
jgi:hypothetical protein